MVSQTVHPLERVVARPHTIVVGYDGSDAAARALDTAANLVGYGATLSVVTVHTATSDRAVASSARRRLHDRHVEARYHEAVGDPADELVETARALGADLLVVAGCSRHPGRKTLGSVSSRVVGRAPCDVLVVR